MVDGEHDRTGGYAQSRPSDNVVPIVSRAGRLADALKRARGRQEEQLRRELANRESSLSHLALQLDDLAEELNSVSDTDAVDRFELIPSQVGDRIVVDTLSYVDIDPQSAQYRLRRQRREGPDTLFESSDRDAMTDAVADYIAQRLVERELDGPPSHQLMQPVHRSSEMKLPESPKQTSASTRTKRSLWPGLGLFFLGVLCGVFVLFLWAWFAYPGS
ncbi:MAG: hypothetical protein AAF739_03780 [Pseudomonadota bacterium]